MLRREKAHFLQGYSLKTIIIIFVYWKARCQTAPVYTNRVGKEMAKHTQQ